MQTPIIRDKIYDIRGQKVMLDFDLAALYGVETKVFNQAVKRNINRFPEDFMFQLTAEEWRWSQIVTSSGVELESEKAVSMLASVLRSEKAVQMSIAVVRAFIALKQYVVRQDGISQQLQEIRDRLGEHDVQLNSIYEAIENLLDEKVGQRNWEDRERIGFKAK